MALPDVTTTYTVTVTSAEGCTDTDEVIVTVLDLPTVMVDNINNCFGGSTTLNPTTTGTGPFTYMWSPEGNLDDPTSANPTATPTVTTTYNVTVTDANGCSATDDVVVTVFQSEHADAGPDQTICEGGSADLTATGGVSYVWDDPSGATTATVTVSPTGATTTYTVTVTDIDGCIDTDQVVVNTVPAPIVTVEDETICADEMATLTSMITGGLGTVTYQWQESKGGNNWTDIPGATSDTYTTPALIGNTFYRLVTTWTGTGCDEVISNEATVIVEPASQVANVVAGMDTICIGESTVLTVNSGIQTGGVIDYSTWTEGTGSAPGFTRIGNNLESTRLTDLDPWGNPTVVWEANRTDASNRPDGGWNTPRFDVDHTETYRFSVWVKRKILSTNGRVYLGTRGFGSVDGVSALNGTVTTNPYFLVSANPTNEFDEDEWVLIVGHVHSSSSTNTNRHADSGIYSLCGGRINDVDNDFRWLPETEESLHRTFLYDDDDENAVQQFVYPRVDIIDGTEPSIDELLYGFDATKGLGAGANYEWFTGSCGGTSAGTGPELTVTPTQTTTYYVRATGTCSTTECEEVTIVVNDPMVTLSGPANACVNDDELTITASLVPGTVTGDSGVFTPLAGLTDNGDGTATIDVAVAGPGTHTVEYTYTDGHGCPAVASTEVEVFDIPAANAGIDLTICEGDSIQLMGTGAGTLEWSPATGLSDPNVADPLAFPTTTTTYTLTVTSADGCVATDEVTVNVNESLDANAVVVENDFCEDGSGEVTVTVLNGTGPFTIEWQNTDGNEVGNANLLSIGDYTITGLNGGTTYCIQVTDSNGCTIINP